MKSAIPWLALVLVLAISGCNRPHVGQSSANESPVPDGHIVLVRQGKEVGSFLLYDQTFSPENTSYKWFARSDGGGTFSDSDPLVSSGSKVDQSEIMFSVFHIDWSSNGKGKGWVYFSKMPTDLTTAAGFEMCVTGETDIAKIDANDPKWKFRERPSVNWKALATP